ncbi:MAG: putative glycosyltransferase, exosortase G system-associated [Lachnospiraceae bacterium]|nr:putative glycosyltransferase, exosortase G system-associated [Lachnospiraceae bacterium]
MTVINSFLNSFLFWAAWIIIPFIMEIIPSIGSFLILMKKKLFPSNYEDPLFWPEVTLIIPVYNSQDSLEECIRSINDSDYPNEKMRIFLVNNQGKDDSFRVYTECQELFPDLLMQWLNARQGKSRALNLALFNADGKYIIHVDSDGQFEPHAISNMVRKFEACPQVDCMTGAILTMPEMIEEYKGFFAKLLRKMEFMEYAQAFLAGRNYASETNSIYTLSGAFSAFRKSAVLKSQLYNTDTICEDTNITFQMKYLQHTKVHICENAIFCVDPIEGVNKLYTQRQRWQRGSLEVSHQFLEKDLKVRKMFTNVMVRTLMYDHTFAFPRLIWYLALICLMCMNYSPEVILVSTGIIFLMYIASGFLYYFSTIGCLKEFADMRRYYRRQWYIVPLLPLFNLAVFFIRFAGVINSINTDSAWKTRTLTDERKDFQEELKAEAKKPMNLLQKARKAVNYE